MENRRDFVGGNGNVVAQARFDRVRQALAWRKDKIAKLREAIVRGDGRAIDVAMMAIRLPAGQITDLGFRVSDLEWYAGNTRDHLYNGWSDQTGRAHTGLAYVLYHKIRSRKELNEQLHRDNGHAPRGLSQRRASLQKAIAGIEPRVKAMERFLALVEGEIKVRRSGVRNGFAR